MAANGFGGMLRADPPPLCELAQSVAHCWRWCGGWRPDLWLHYAALHEVEDWSLMTELLEILKANG